MEVKKIGNVLEIGGKYYQFTNKYGKHGAMIFKEIDKEKYDVLVDKIIEKLEPFVERKIILKDALAELPPKSLQKISDALEKKKPKVRQRHGCVDIVVAGEVIQLR